MATVYKPEPPAKTESVSLFGLDNGVWRLTFLLGYYGSCALTMRSAWDAALWQVLFLNFMCFVFGCYLAQEVNGFACDMADRDKRAAYARELLAALERQPIEGYKRSDDGDDFEPVRSPLRERPVPRLPPERPLLDRDLGVRVRP